MCVRSCRFLFTALESSHEKFDRNRAFHLGIGLFVFAITIAHESLVINSEIDSFERLMSRNRRNSVASQMRKAQSELEARYAEIAKAYLDQDLETILAIRTEGYTVQLTDGSILDSTQMQNQAQQTWEQIEKTTKMEYSILSLSVNFEDATVVVQQTWHRRQNTGEKVQSIETVMIHRDFWENVSGQWRLKSSVDLDDKSVIVDGVEMKKKSSTFSSSLAK